MKDKFHNRTRTVESIPRSLLANKKPHYLPLYALLKTSKLANEGMKNSGSYFFADHIYERKAQGNYIIGRFVDWTVLRLPSATEFRQRYIHANQLIKQKSLKEKKLKILVAPAGLAREVFDHGQLLKRNGHVVHALDLDQNLVDIQNEKASRSGLPITYFKGDVLEPRHYPTHTYDLILCMGLTEFLDDQTATKVFKIFHTKLSDKGVLYTSSTNIHKLSDKLLRNLADLHTNYRTSTEIHEILDSAGYRIEHSRQTKRKLQTIVKAVKK